MSNLHSWVNTKALEAPAKETAYRKSLSELSIEIVHAFSDILLKGLIKLYEVDVKGNAVNEELLWNLTIYCIF